MMTNSSKVVKYPIIGTLANTTIYNADTLNNMVMVEPILSLKSDQNVVAPRTVNKNIGSAKRLTIPVEILTIVIETVAVDLGAKNG